MLNFNIHALYSCVKHILCIFVFTLEHVLCIMQI
nr:MAG TPA: hypothetical protein [Caudoviricetes sp.]